MTTIDAGRQHPHWSRVLAGVMRAQHEDTPSRYSTYAADCIATYLPTLPSTAEDQLHDLLQALIGQYLTINPDELERLLRTVSWAVLAELSDWTETEPGAGGPEQES